MNCNLLFVYGTLMRGATGRLGAVERRRLAQEGEYLGEAHVRGRLYNLGAYPGLAVPGDAAEIVHGEVFELCAPQATLRWLDAYEGVGPGCGPLDEYRREILEVKFVAGGNCEAWCYVYRQDIGAATIITCGRWLS